MTDLPVTVEEDIEVLLDKLDRWLLVQPEWLLLMGLPERQIRKQVATLVAKELLLMPKREYGGEPNRAMRRQIIAAMRKSKVPWWDMQHALTGDAASWTYEEDSDDIRGTEEGPGPAVPEDEQEAVHRPDEGREDVG